MTVAPAVERFLEAHEAGRLFIEVNLDDTHRPYPVDGEKDGARPAIPPYLPEGPAADEELRAAQEAIEEMDAAVGRVLDALERSG